MKRLTCKTLLTLFLLICATILSAQELTVKSFTVAPTDLSASTKSRLDLDDNPCGLVKVQLAVAGAKFDGNVIPPVERKVSEYWVYMTEGSKELRINVPGFIPLHVNFGDYQISGIKPITTYLMSINTPRNTTETDNGLQYLVLTVSPTNSAVFIDGYGQTVVNGTVSALLSQGNHTYRVVASGYATEEGTVEIGNSKKTVEVTLKAIQTKLSVSCPTSGAQVWINDLLGGAVPWASSLSPGNYIIEVRKEGYRSYRETITLSESEDRELSVPALRLQAGSLDVNYQPLNAEVYIDGQRKGTTPDLFQNIPIGNHKVEIRKSGYVSKQETISIQDGQTVSLTGQLQELKPKKSEEASISTDSSNTVHQNASSVVSKTPITKLEAKTKAYQQPTSLYLQANGQVGSLMAIGLNVGGYISNVNIEAYYLYGLSRSEEIYWIPQNTGPIVHGSYRPMVYGLKVGYGFITAKSHLRLTPQIGASIVSIRSNVTNGTSKAYAVPGVVGMNATYAFSPLLGIYVAPEVSFALKKSNVYSQLADVSSKVKSWGTGFNVQIGLRFSF